MRLMMGRGAVLPCMHRVRAEQCSADVARSLRASLRLSLHFALRGRCVVVDFVSYCDSKCTISRAEADDVGAFVATYCDSKCTKY